MGFNLKTLFGQKSPTEQVTTDAQAAIPAAPVNNDPNSKRATETYANWGKRICATTSGNSTNLAAFLNNVYNYIKYEQLSNQAFQQQERAKLEGQIKQTNNEIDLCNTLIKNDQNTIAQNKKLIADCQDEIYKKKEEGSKKNKSAAVQRAFGFIILIPLTIYLFFFYSSTFYSAFFSGGKEVTSAAAAMFNPEAFRLAWEHSPWAFFTIIVFPVIFLGLGFSLHYISKSEGKSKYFKMAVIVLVTFLFDSILAYKIGETLHNWQVMNGIIEEVPYSISLAMSDINTWAVIFCGFIAYIIWGVVFDLTMEAHEKIDSNKIAIMKIENDINNLKSNNQQLEGNITQRTKQITNLKNIIIDLEAKILQGKWFDLNNIAKEMNNFYSGWVAQMKFLGMDALDLKGAQIVYQESMNNLKLQIPTAIVNNNNNNNNN